MNNTSFILSKGLSAEDFERMNDLSSFLSRDIAEAALLGPDGQKVDLPSGVFEILQEVVELLSAGKAVHILHTDMTLTTQEAANYLGISRPTLVSLLEKGKIPYSLPSGRKHRKIKLVDLIEYSKSSTIERKAGIDELTAESSAVGLYDTGIEDYADALKRARKGRTKSV